jgi:hypothetical protein
MLFGWSLYTLSGSPTPEAGAQTWQVRIAPKVDSSWPRTAVRDASPGGSEAPTTRTVAATAPSYPIPGRHRDRRRGGGPRLPGLRSGLSGRSEADSGERDTPERERALPLAQRLAERGCRRGALTGGRADGTGRGVGRVGAGADLRLTGKCCGEAPAGAVVAVWVRTSKRRHCTFLLNVRAWWLTRPRKRRGNGKVAKICPSP